jgi:hypothetical protein
MATPPSELRVITAAKNLATYLFQVLEKAPKKFRYSLITRLENKSIDVVEALYAANVAVLGDSKRRKRQEQTRLSFLALIIK